MNYTKDFTNGGFVVNTRELKNLNLCLEIGCFEGRTSNHIIDNMLAPEGKLLAVDPLTEVYYNENITPVYDHDNKVVHSYFNGQYERYISNTKQHHESGKIELYRDLSEKAFPRLQKYKGLVQFAYVDGDHRAAAAYLDGVESFKLCAKGAMILFDDYAWAPHYGEEAPKVGIDRFVAEYNEHIEKSYYSEGQWVVILKA
jgi:hypothetical protein